MDELRGSGTEERSWVLCSECEVVVQTDNGARSVRALASDYIPGLAVTHHPFGRFSVTHAATGLLVAGPYQRYGNAVLAMVDLGSIIDWTDDRDGLARQLIAKADEPVRFPGATVTTQDGVRPMTVREYRDSLRSEFPDDEFPWESSDEDPVNMALHHARLLYPAVAADAPSDESDDGNEEPKGSVESPD